MGRLFIFTKLLFGDKNHSLPDGHLTESQSVALRITRKLKTIIPHDLNDLKLMYIFSQDRVKLATDYTDYFSSYIIHSIRIIYI